MNILIQAADLDRDRIDGTRVYLREVLRRLGNLDSADTFSIAHQAVFNPALAPPSRPNYVVRAWPPAPAWMQTRFVRELFRLKPNLLWLPVQAIPWAVPRLTRVVVTVHDLAWKYFPETFTPFQRWRLEIFLGMVVKRADRLIAVSEATKNDLLKFYPHLRSERVQVVHHGIDREFFGQRISDDELNKKLARFKLQPSSYLLFVGALQPRKNLECLIHAFEKARETYPDMRLVLAGEPAWRSNSILSAIGRSPHRAAIVQTGQVSLDDARALYQGARALVFPSLYEGFGLPILEAFAAGVPVLTADNSSLPEVAGDAALYCHATDETDLAEKIRIIWSDDRLREELVQKGKSRLTKFSWDRCTRETLAVLQAAGHP